MQNFLKDNSQNKFMELYLPVAESLERFTLSLCYNRDLAKEIVGRTVEKAYRNFEKLKLEQSFQSYLFTIARNEFYQNHKENKFKNSVEISSIEEIFGYQQDIEDIIDAEIVLKALNQLKPEHKEALILAEMFDYEHKEIAEIQSTTVANIKIRVFRAKQIIKKYFTESEIQKVKIK